MNIKNKIQHNFNRLFHRIDKNLQENKAVIRKVNFARKVYSVNIPPVLYEMLNTENVLLKPRFDLNGELEEIVISPIRELKENVS